jgi:hypothetical protein
MATKAAAMPQLVRRNCRRFRPSRAALASASSTMRRSTFFWVALCLGGRYSPLETIWVGIGVAADASSAPATRRCSRSLSQLPIGFLRLVGQREEPIGARFLGARGRSGRCWSARKGVSRKTGHAVCPGYTQESLGLASRRRPVQTRISARRFLPGFAGEVSLMPPPSASRAKCRRKRSLCRDNFSLYTESVHYACVHSR